MAKAAAVVGQGEGHEHAVMGVDKHAGEYIICRLVPGWQLGRL
jgi:hypothetical protein